MSGITTELTTLTQDEISNMVDELHKERIFIVDQECEMVESLYKERKSIIDQECKVHKLLKKIQDA